MFIVVKKSKHIDVIIINKMIGNNNIKEIDMKNVTNYYFDNVIKINGFNPRTKKLDKKQYRNILI